MIKLLSLLKIFIFWSTLVAITYLAYAYYNLEPSIFNWESAIRLDFIFTNIFVILISLFWFLGNVHGD